MDLSPRKNFSKLSFVRSLPSHSSRTQSAGRLDSLDLIDQRQKLVAVPDVRLCSTANGFAPPGPLCSTPLSVKRQGLIWVTDLPASRVKPLAGPRC